MFNDYYKGRKVFVTGHTGFKGGWLSLWLRTLGAKVTGYSLDPPTDPNLFEVIGDYAWEKSVHGDVRDARGLAKAVDDANPDVVFHLAAQPIVRLSYDQPIETLETNVTGTALLLEALRRRGKKTNVVVVTSDKCYLNREWEFAYRESDPLGGKDVYSMSKAAAELVTYAWNHSYFLRDPWQIRVATARAGNVIGGGDYTADRLLPDAMRSLAKGQPVPVRNPRSTRPWQHVLESVSGYLWLAAFLDKTERPSPQLESVNFGPQPGANRSVKAVLDEVFIHWPGSIHDASDPRAPHEATNLSVAIDRAITVLGWQPIWDFSTGVRETVRWYKCRHHENCTDMLGFSRSQIEQYSADAASSAAIWSN